MILQKSQAYFIKTLTQSAQPGYFFMSKEFETEVRTYNDILKDYQDITAWKDPRNFDITKLSKSQEDRLKQLTIVEVVFQRQIVPVVRDEKIFNVYEQFLKSLLIKTTFPIFMVSVGNFIEEKNRLRTYKGLLKQKFNDKDIIEKEFVVEDNITFFAAIAKINDNNIDLIFNYFYESSNCFLMLSGKEIFNLTFVEDIAHNHIMSYQMISCNINYLSFCLKYVEDDNLILRCAGNGGDFELSLQLFMKNEMVEQAKKDIDLNLF